MKSDLAGKRLPDSLGADAIRRNVFKIVRQRKQMNGGQDAGRSKVTNTLPFAVRALGPSSGSVRRMKNQPNLFYQTNPPRDPSLARKIQSTKSRLLRQTCVVLTSLALGIAAFAPHSSSAASSDGCEGGGFAFLALTGDQKDTLVSAASLPSTFLVKGKYVEFTVDAATFGLYNWTLTGAANPLDLTGGKRTVVFSSKLPDHRGLVLTSDLEVDDSSDEWLVISSHRSRSDHVDPGQGLRQRRRLPSRSRER